MWGKVLGAMIGAGLGMLLAWSPLLAAALAAAGAILGHLAVDHSGPGPRLERPPSSEELLERQTPRGAARRPQPAPARAAPPPRGPSREQQALADLLCPLFIEIARVDGPVVQPEIRAVREFFEHALRFDEVGTEAVRVALKAALAAPPQDVEFLVRRARSEVRPAQRLEVVRALYDLATVDGPLLKSEQAALREAVQHFNLADEQVQQITREFFGGGARAYATLGLGEDASDDDIRSAFRRLAAEHHPDRVAHLDAAAAAVATERFREVKEAWEELKRLRGL